MVGTGGSIGTGGSVGTGPGMAGRGSAGTTGSGGITMVGVGGTSVTGFGGAGGTGGTAPTRNLPGEAQGFWRFDDCNMDRTELFDSSFIGGHTAYRSVTAFCRPGIINTGIGFDEDD